jgi:uncharacterized membrane protein YdjX (TVP38/TMEM64 family)
MNLNSSSPKLILGITYLAIISTGLYFLFSAVDSKDLMSYEFIRQNKDVILKYKNENFLFLTAIFFIFSIIWVLLLGFAMPLLIFSGFVFGKWWGILIALTATTIGATLLYLLVGFFFREAIKEKLAPKFSKLKEFFTKNDILYFTSFRFVGGGGTPYAIQNILPILFNMSVKNYIIATFIGSMPSMFVTVALGSGIENIIDQNASLSITNVLLSPEIYLPIIGFFIILIVALLIKKFYFKKQNIN